MIEYHKIQSLYKRDEKTHKFIEGEYSRPEFEYLRNNVWVGTEKVDGTNIRVIWNPGWVEIVDRDVQINHPDVLDFKGKTDNAQIPTFLLSKLQEIFTVEKMKAIFSTTPVCLYGEGYGARIQKGGGNYILNDVDFILFDVKIDGWWLKREDVEDIAIKLGICRVPIVYTGPLDQAVEMVRNGFKSTVARTNSGFKAEGLVLKPQVDLFARNHERIITKIKEKDFA